MKIWIQRCENIFGIYIYYIFFVILLAEQKYQVIYDRLK
jgi:hypothetical protein